MSQLSESNFILKTDVMASLMGLADVMAKGTVMVPDHLRGKQSDCLAIVMQAARWGMDPFAVAQKTHLVNGTLGYEAQLVNALVSSSNATSSRFKYEYAGDWSKCTRSRETTVQKPAKGGGTYAKTRRVRAWSDADEEGLSVRVGAVLAGEAEITWGQPVYLSGVVVRNSPLWVTKPDQQIAYLAVKYWARLYCPEVILGVYTHDEIPQRQERDITPPAVPTQGNRAKFRQLVSQKPAEPKNEEVEVQPENEPDNPHLEALLNALDDVTDERSYCDVAGHCTTLAPTLPDAQRDMLREKLTRTKARVEIERRGP